MKCQNCHQPTEAGAAFCGNCGHPITGSHSVPHTGLPRYAKAKPAIRVGENRLLVAQLCGVIGLIGALFIPLVGIMLGLTGVVLATTIWGSPRRHAVRLSLAFSVLAMLTGLANWVYLVKHDPNFGGGPVSAQGSNTAVSDSLATPCYSANFIDRLNVSNDGKGCDMSAYNGQTINLSTNAYKVYANHATILNGMNFTNQAKTALEKDIAYSLPGFSVDSERVSGFAGSPAYSVYASDKTNGVAIVETAVYHPVKSGDNIFILIHTVTGDAADLRILEAQWQWK